MRRDAPHPRAPLPSLMARASDPAAARRDAAAVVRALRDRGHVAYFAGGCVRDELLGQHPTDYDIATDAIPAQVRAVFRRTREVGAAFGVMLIPMRDSTIEVATFRTEGTYTDKRRPDSVAFSTAEMDARRRDFTINALFLDPLSPPDAAPGTPEAAVDGRVIDFVGGIADLHARVLRAVGDPAARLAEDHLRALRAVRFAARLGFALDPGTAEAIRTHARELTGISRERIGEELRRMLPHPSRGRAVAILTSLELDAPALGEPSCAAALAQAGGSSPRVTALPTEADHPTALAAWALDRADPQPVPESDPGSNGATPRPPVVIPAADRDALVLRWRKSLCLSNHDRDRLAATLSTHEKLAIEWPSISVARRKRGAGRASFRPAWWILRSTHPRVADSITQELASVGVDLTKPPPEPWVNGDDLIGLGLVPGPQFKRLLDAAYDAQLDGSAATKTEALELARRLGV